MNTTKTPHPESGSRANRVELILSQLENLPTLPAVAVRLVQLTVDRHASAKQVISLIESDPSLTAKILKLARRADSGIHPDTARTVERAVVMLGFDAIRNAVLSIKVFEAFGPEVDPQAAGPFNRQDFWKHSLAVGCAAKLLAGSLSVRIDPEEAFVCGLLHDLGKVALDTILPKSYVRVIDIARTERTAVSDVENRLLGVDHTLVGKRLGVRWGLPESIVTSMWLHHQDPEMLPRAVPGRDYARLVYLADLVVREHRIGFGGNSAFASGAKTLAARMGIVESDYERALQRLAEDIEQRADLLGLRRVTQNSLYLRALAEANAELGRLNEQHNRTNRQLQRRSRYLDILAELNESLARRPDLASLCGLCAKGLCQAVEATGGAVMAVDRSGLCAVGYFADGHVGECWARVQPQPPMLPFPEAVAASRHFRPRPVSTDDPLLAACEEYLPAGPSWLIELDSGQEWNCVAIVSAPAERVNQWDAEGSELDVLQASLRLALRQAIAAQHAQELAESLAEQARKLHEAEPRKIRQKSLDITAEMAAGAGHEMNNPLAIISGRAQLLKGRIGDSDNVKAVETIVEQAHRCSQIVSELMSFAKPPPARPGRLALPSFLGAALRQWAEKNGLSLTQAHADLPQDLPDVLFDREHLAAIVQEILDNSLQAAGEDSSRLRVNCRAKASDESVVLSISDNGPGMSPDVLTKALLPFFSYRPAGRRRGLGLSRAYRLAELNGGDLWLESLPAEGTTVYVRLPIAPSEE
jgi:putative nucleotidyltransferase with HDIG domain